MAERDPRPATEPFLYRYSPILYSIATKQILMRVITGSHLRAKPHLVVDGEQEGGYAPGTLQRG